MFRKRNSPYRRGRMVIGDGSPSAGSKAGVILEITKGLLAADFVEGMGSREVFDFARQP